jgi:aromatic ring-opening dioxygenase catalytic subunit (LigB family)
MGEIVGAAIVSHVPPIALPEAERRALNEGRDFSLVEGLHRIKRECLDRLQPDTIIVFDTHWFTTFEHIVTAHERRTGRYTSDELPRGMTAVPYDVPGDPELADAIAAQAEGRDDTWIHATRDPYIAIHYPTVNLLPYLQDGQRWISAGTCQTATAEDFLLFGALLALAVGGMDRRVVLLGSGGLSHRFWPLRELRSHESAGLEHIVTPEARAADEELLARFERGDHAAVLASYPAYRTHAPEAFFAHYLVLVGAIGGSACRARGVRYSDYESAAGTGQVHIWFDRPEGGWTA